jgi:hypothetical protein
MLSIVPPAFSAAVDDVVQHSGRVERNMSDKEKPSSAAASGADSRARARFVNVQARLRRRPGLIRTLISYLI